MVETGVTLDESSYWARWATWQSRAKRRHVTAVADGTSATPAMFASNDVLVSRHDREAVARLIEWGAEVVEPPPLADPPPGVHVRDDVGDFPMPVTLRFSDPPDVADAERRLARAYEARELETRPELTLTSQAGARVAAAVAELQSQGHQVDLNWLGMPDVLTLKTAAEQWTGGNDPFTWPSHTGRSRIVDAWQLVESFRAQKSLKPVVWIAVLDGGFALVNGVDPGNDLPGFGYDLASGSVANAGGVNPNTCGSSSCPWHGHGVASAAAATVNNSLGAAGAGGTVARMVFFKTTLSVSQTLQCLRICTAWGLDVLNMSFSLRRVELFFPTSDWDDAFEFAISHGVIPVAAAGNGDSDNVGQKLPDYNVRPATRTPGVITVGALDGADQATGFSNYGSSLTVWAPGVGIPVGPDPANPAGSAPSGTSQAAPLVAGVVAMMRAVNPGIDALTARTVLRDTGWTGTGRVTKGLDAYAAVLSAMGGSLPADLNEDDDTASRARPLLRRAAGGPLTTLRDVCSIGPGDADMHRLDVPTLSTVSLAMEWYQRLGPLSVTITAEDPATQESVDALVRAFGPTPGTVTYTGVLPPGRYVVAVRANRVNSYTLAVTLAALMLAPDVFEPNDSLDRPARVWLHSPSSPASFLVGWGPGAYDCTLHPDGAGGTNPDYFELHTPAHQLLQVPLVRIEALDARVDVRLYDSAGVEVASWPGQRMVRFRPDEDTVTVLEVRGAVQTRYHLTVGLELDRDAMPDPFQRPYDPIPGWWDGPWEGRLRGPEQYFSVQVEPREMLGRDLRFETTAASARLVLHHLDGKAVREARRDGDVLSLDVTDLEAGHYVVQAVVEEADVLSVLRTMRPTR
jgi:hypothetical protein